MALRASGDNDMEYRKMVANIAKRVDDYTLEDLKYQCRGVIGPGRLEKVTNALGLFEILEERDEINMEDVDFLHKILNNIDRMDLCKLVKIYREAKSETSPPSRESAHATSEMEFAPSSHRQEIPQTHQTLSSVTSPPPGKVFSQDDTSLQQKMVSHGAHYTAPDGQNCTIPFETSESDHHISGNYNAHHRQRDTNPPAPRSGYATSPELAAALELVISSISRGWQSAARYLGVPDTIIDQAEDNWPRNVRNQIGEAFRYWARNDRQASSHKLILAMRNVGRNDIADDLQYG